ncbi:MAG: hypothetical protein DRQ40_07495 [Gammaproteobacteria bacterium]|nr:MAG: hypothetical protein DRQ40_07495 [Gammaproteobacteria bacterium]
METARIELFERAMTAFSMIRGKYAKYGAIDTEIGYQLRDQLHIALRDGNSTAIKWELYTASMNCNRANIGLNKAWAQVADIIGGFNDEETQYIVEYYGV